MLVRFSFSCKGMYKDDIHDMSIPGIKDSQIVRSMSVSIRGTGMSFRNAILRNDIRQQRSVSAFQRRCSLVERRTERSL